MVGIGPFLNEPGDANGHGLWDPLNMLRTLLNYAEAHPEHERTIAMVRKILADCSRYYLILLN